MELQQVAEDMKEIIRHINEANKTMDKSDPVHRYALFYIFHNIERRKNIKFFFVFFDDRFTKF